MTEEKIGDIILRKVRADGIVMSRVPKRVRDNFIKLAEDEFAGDYGLTLKDVFNQYEEYQRIKLLLFDRELILKILEKI